MVKITNDNFDSEIRESSVPVLVDFWASWCQPCKMMKVMLEDMIDDFQGQVKFCEVNIEDVSIPHGYELSSVPTLMVVKDGVIIDKKTGFKDRGDIESMLDKILVAV